MEKQTRGNEVINSSGLNKLDAEKIGSKGMLGLDTTHLLVALDRCNIHLDQDSKPEIPTIIDRVDIFKVRVSSHIILKRMREHSLQMMMIDLIDTLEIRCLNDRL